ncbi:hypothetical protein ACSFA8_22805 [Variovorax sp. RT4R15]|uniref:hypothetical protein n=1 Tax=Variovorax sp. RT4R15 TaxID=3443737 RepID=UPI003F458FC4
MSPKEIVEAWHVTWRKDPAEANKLYLADNVKVLLPGAKAVVGWKAANEHFLRVAAGLKSETLIMDPAYIVFVCEDNKVARRFRLDIESSDGAKCEMFVFNFYIVENEKIVHFEEHFDTYARSQSTDLSLYRKDHDPRAWIVN